LKHVVFSPNGKFIAASNRCDIFVWDGTNGTILCTLTGLTSYVYSLDFSPDSTILASYSPADGVFLWDVGMKESIPRPLSNSSINVTHSSWIVFNATGTQLAVVFVVPIITDEGEHQSFQVRIWDVSNSNGEDSAEPRNESFQSKSNDEQCPHFLRLSSNESLTRVRRLSPYENKVIVWDRMTDAVEEHDCNQVSRSSSKPAFHYDRGWIVSVRTGRRLFWLPESRRPYYDGFCSSFATHGNLIAIGPSNGAFSLVDMSPFEGK
jgi:WD40 repeat protein